MMTNHRPNTDQAARDTLEDLGLIDDDRTEGLSAVAVVGEGAPAVSDIARELMDWDAYHPERSARSPHPWSRTSSAARRSAASHLEDALAAMKPKPSVRKPEEVAALCARLERPKLAALDEPGTPSQYPVVDLDDPDGACHPRRVPGRV
jgi:hypothetical protein